MGERITEKTLKLMVPMQALAKKEMCADELREHLDARESYELVYQYLNKLKDKRLVSSRKKYVKQAKRSRYITFYRLTKKGRTVLARLLAGPGAVPAAIKLDKKCKEWSECQTYIDSLKDVEKGWTCILCPKASFNI